MFNKISFRSTLACLVISISLLGGLTACQQINQPPNTTTIKDSSMSETPDYFLLRPKVEKEYGYTHAVRIGKDIKISGAVSMDDSGVLTAAGNLEQQMKNCYSDLEKILKHYGCSFDDVIVENVFTTDMPGFIKSSGFRNTIYKKNFPTGTWLEVKGLALEGQLIEIDMEARKNN